MSDAELISRISNMIIMVTLSMSNDNMNRCKHYLSDELFNKLSNRVLENKNVGRREMFDEPNVSTVSIISKTNENNKEVVKAKILFKAVHYYNTYESYEYIDGDNYNKEHFEYIVTLEKDEGIENIMYKCPHCGADVDVTYNGICIYCSMPYDFQGKDYIITNYELN